MLTPKQKQTVINKFRTHDSDTGSPQVQVAILTTEIKDLTEHLRTHKKDYSSRRGLIKKVNERRRLLKYLEREDKKAWQTLKDTLGLK
ncbi:MAG TPA: 30S ribosomal protein S15 [Patescibacteria group bacterium]|nr:30S ribosomal protein S15 [Patescibacteria group bacterium]